MPNILLENCTECLKCVKDCPSDAIDIKSGSIADTCIHCGHCVAICPESTIFPDSGEILPLKNSRINAEDFEVFISGVRSIRYYLKKEVPDEILLRIVENMRHYSSASNARPLEITYVRSQEKIQELNDKTLHTLLKPISLITSPILRPIIKIFVPSINVKTLKQYKDSFILRKQTNTSLVCHHAPVVLLFHGKKARYDMSDADAYIWAGNTVLYAKTLGLGACFIGFIVRAMERNKKLKKSMNVPSDHNVYAALVLGYPKVTYRNETSRNSPNVSWV